MRHSILDHILGQFPRLETTLEVAQLREARLLGHLDVWSPCTA